MSQGVDGWEYHVLRDGRLRIDFYLENGSKRIVRLTAQQCTDLSTYLLDFGEGRP